MPATITINLQTHREACINQSDPNKAAALYDQHAEEFLVHLAHLARWHQIKLEIEDRWPAQQTYEVSGDSPIDVQAADYFMRRHGSFWGWLARGKA